MSTSPVSNSERTPAPWGQALKISFQSTGTVLSIMPLLNTKLKMQLIQAQNERFQKAQKERRVLQEKKLTLLNSRRELFRGTTTFWKAFLPTTVAQGLMTDGIKNAIAKRNHGIVTDVHAVIAAFFGGAGSAVFLCPATSVMVYQKKHQVAALIAFKTLYNNFGIWQGFYRTLFAMKLREGCSTAAFFALAPFFKRKIEPHVKNETAQVAFSRTLAAFFAAVFSHHADSRITLLNDVPGQNVPITREFIVRTGWTGLFPRIGMMFVGVNAFESSGTLYDRLKRIVQAL